MSDSGYSSDESIDWKQAIRERRREKERRDRLERIEIELRAHYPDAIEQMRLNALIDSRLFSIEKIADFVAERDHCGRSLPWPILDV